MTISFSEKHTKRIFKRLSQPPIFDKTLPIWQAKKDSDNKHGTLTLEHKPYTQANNNLPGITQLHLNENLFATTQSAINQPQLAASLTAYLENLHSYPTNGVTRLQEAIAAGLHIPKENIVMAHGSADILRNLFLYLLKKDDAILVPQPGWSFYHTIADLVGARIDTFPMPNNGRSFVYDKQIIARKIEQQKPKVVLICTPNNPTGNVMPIADFLELMQQYPDINFILDEAYYGFSESSTLEQVKALLESIERDNVFVVRTFSKFYGLANLRLGFLLCNRANGEKLRKLAPVFGITSLNQELAALRFCDTQFYQDLRQEFADVNAYVYSSLAQIPGLTPYETHANFILVEHDERWFNVEDDLLEYGFKIKRETMNGARNYLRVTYADLETMTRLMTIFAQLACQKTAVSPQPFQN